MIFLNAWFLALSCLLECSESCSVMGGRRASRRYLEIESDHLDTQTSPASDILHGEEYNIMVSSAKYHLTPSQEQIIMNERYVESVKQCIFIHPNSGTACVIGKLAESQFDVLWNKRLTPLLAFAAAIASVKARNT